MHEITLYNLSRQLPTDAALQDGKYAESLMSVFSDIKDLSFMIDDRLVAQFMEIASKGTQALSPIFDEAYKKNVRMSGSHTQQPDEHSLQDLKTTAQLDPRNFWAEWCFLVSAKIDNFLSAVQQGDVNQSLYGQVILKQLFPAKAKADDRWSFYETAMLDLRSVILSTVVNSLSTKFLENKYPDVFTEQGKDVSVSSSKIAEAELYKSYLSRVFTPIFNHIPFTKGEDGVHNFLINGFKIEKRPSSIEATWIDKQILRFYEHLYTPKETETNGNEFLIHLGVNRLYQRRSNEPTAHEHVMPSYKLYNEKVPHLRRGVVGKFIEKIAGVALVNEYLEKHEKQFENMCLDITKKAHENIKKELQELYVRLKNDPAFHKMDREYGGFSKMVGELILHHLDYFYEIPRVHSTAEIKEFEKFCVDKVQASMAPIIESEQLKHEKPSENNVPQQKKLGSFIEKCQEATGRLRKAFANLEKWEEEALTTLLKNKTSEFKTKVDNRCSTSSEFLAAEQPHHIMNGPIS